MRRALFAIGVLLGGLGGANAADLAVKAPYAPLSPVPVSNWTGVYVGGFIMGAWASGNYCAPFLNGANDGCADQKSTAFGGGGYLGFEYELSNRFVVGAKITAPFGAFNNPKAPAGSLIAVLPNTTFAADENYAVLIDATVGYDMGKWLPYFGVGIASAGVKATVTGPPGVATATSRQTGLDVLVGVRYALTNNWTAGIQYNHVMFDRTPYYFTGSHPIVSGQNIPIQITTDVVMGTIDYRF